MIDPATNKDGETFEGYNRRRWGGSGWTHHLKQEGRKDGAMFNDWKWWPNTLNAHRLVLYASTKGGVDTSISNSVLFNAIYEHGENISLIDTLVTLGSTKLGLNENELRTYLLSNDGTQQVLDEINNGRRQYKVSSVPFFVVGPKDQSRRPYGFSGAQSTQAFVDIFHELTE